MTEDRDPLEIELAGIILPELSPGLRRRIGQALSHPSRPAGGRVRWWVGGLIAAAACVAVGVLGWRVAHDRVIDRSIPILPGQQEAIAPAAVDPTLGSYQLVLARSPERLDAMLDAQGTRPFGASTPRWPAFAHLDQHSNP